MYCQRVLFVLASALCLAAPYTRDAAAEPDGRDIAVHGRTAPRDRRGTTTWDLKPSLAFDALTALNMLTGDPYYLEYYGTEWTHFARLLTPEARAALAGLKRKIKDEGGGIISAFLTLYFSAVDPETLDDLLATVDDSREMQRRLSDTPYYSESGWALYESVRGELREILRFLDAIGFPEYWRTTIRPRVMVHIAELTPRLPGFDVVGEVEALLGHPLASDTVTVYVLYFSQPHGIKITGTRFLTDVAWPFGIVLRNAVHEMMHPPYDGAGDAELRNALGQLKADSFLLDKIEHHDPSFGYNTFEGFLEEDVVQAAEQVITERLGVARDPRQRWRENDGGIHVLAAALYHVMREEGFPRDGQSLRDFLLEHVTRGRLRPGSIEREFRAFLDGASENGSRTTGVRGR